MKPIAPAGPEDAPLLIVSSAPCDEELRHKSAGHGLGYELLLDALHDVGIDTKNVRYCHAYPELRARGTLTQAQLDKWKEFLRLECAGRECVVALGKSAAYATGILGTFKATNVRKGRKLKVQHEEDQDAITMLYSDDLFFLEKEPEKTPKFAEHFEVVRRILTKQPLKLPRVTITYIEKPEDVNALYLAIRATPKRLAAYDYEADTLNATIATPACLAFCLGKCEDGSYNVWVWVNEDKLIPRYDHKTQKRFKRIWKEFFMRARRKFKLIAHNRAYDDWITKAYFKLDDTFKGSTHDTMIQSWSVDNSTRNGLKEIARQLGYPDYDAKIDALVSEVSSRRGRVLTHPDDFRTLERFNYKPVLTETTLKNGKVKRTYKWPKEADKKLAAWSLIDTPTLVRYCAYDTVMTWKSHVKFYKTICNEGLRDSYEFRMKISDRAIASMQRGFWVDVDLNRKWHRELKEIIADAEHKMRRRLEAMEFDSEFVDAFNPQSGAHLMRVLFGPSVKVPKIDIDRFADNFCSRHRILPSQLEFDAFENEINKIHAEVYNTKAFRQQILLGAPMSNEALKKAIKAKTLKLQSFQGLDVPFTEAPVYYNGMYTPTVFTKTGIPSTAKAVLENYLSQNPEDEFLSLLLIHRRASKILSTFVDGIYDKLDKQHILRSFLNVIGTNSGRCSSCVRAGTLVETSEGLKPIESLKQGDLVLGHDGKYHECLRDAFKKPDSHFYRVTTASGASVDCTLAHRFNTPDGWKRLSELSVHSEVIVYANTPTGATFTTDRIVSIEKLEYGTPWDITVADAESYCAQGLVHHNSSPNSQNFIKYLRGQCQPRKGYTFVEFDLSQAEVRVVAALSKDKALQAALYAADNDKSGKRNVHGLKPDLHTQVAATIYKKSWLDVTENERRAAKTVVFGMVYGMTAKRLAFTLKCEYDEAAQIIEDFFVAFPELKRWLQKQAESTRKAPYYVYTAWGTRRTVKNGLSKFKAIRSAAERVAGNMPVQGTAGEYTLWLIDRILELAEENGLDVHFLNTTHDSGTFEVLEEHVEAFTALIYQAAKEPAPRPQIAKVNFVVDVAINKYWSGEPNLAKAIDPNLADKKAGVRWELINLDLLDPDDRKDLEEIGFAT